MGQPVIAAQLYTLRNLLKDKTEEEIRNVLTQVKAIGYKAVQISGIGEVSPELGETYRKIAEDLELDICATHFSLEYMEDNLDWIVDLHKMWDCQYAGIGSMPDAMRNHESLPTFIERCNALGKELKAEGIQLVYHNHKFEFEQYDHKPWIQHMLEGFHPDYVQLELDTYWVQAGGANPVTWIHKVKDQMGIVHFKDLRIVKDEQQFAEIGLGNLEWNEIMAACIEANVAYIAVEQDDFTEDPLLSLKVSYDYINGL